MVSLHRGGWPETVDWDVFCEDTFGEHFFAASALTPSCGIVYTETMPCSADECTVLTMCEKITTGYRLCLQTYIVARMMLMSLMKMGLEIRLLNMLRSPSGHRVTRKSTDDYKRSVRE